MKYQSEVLKEIIDSEGHITSLLHYESECIEAFIEEYRGEQISKGMKSIMLRVIIDNVDTTMTSEEINSKLESILKTLNKKCGATLREE